jgi:quinol monooxygenase YgiN
MGRTRDAAVTHLNHAVKARFRRIYLFDTVSDPSIELTIVTMVLDAAKPEELSPVVAKYVVLSRQHPGCRNIDLCASITHPGRFVIIEKWESPEAQRAHFDSADMVEMAQACSGRLTRPPDIDLLEGLSAHDLQ